MVGFVGDRLWVLLFLFLIFLICSPFDLVESEIAKLSIGAILDCNLIIGKEEKVAMELAVADLNAPSFHHRVTMHIIDSGGDPVKVSAAAKKLISKHQVRAITGLNRWEEPLFALQISNKSQIPLLSLANDIPHWAPQKWPFLVNATRSHYAQTEAIAAIVQSWKWGRVTLIYEETLNTAIPNLIITSLRKVNADVDEFVPLPPFPPYKNYLLDLKTKGCRVFIVDASIEVAADLLVEANEMGMMEEEYVWITTDSITSRVDSLNPSVISAMQGVLGVKSYYPRNQTRYKEFSSRLKTAFSAQYPNDTYTEPGTNALQAYDAVLTLSNHNLGRIFLDWGGLDVFQIINVVGKSYREIGYWSAGSGFSKSIENVSNYSRQMKILGQVHFPGGPWDVPKVLAIEGYNLKIGVPANTTFGDYLKWDNNTNLLTGFSIDVFEEVIKFMQNNVDYYFRYTLIKIPGNYYTLLDMIYSKEIDGAIGDIAIVGNRRKYGEFSQPYTEAGIQVVAYAPAVGRQWLFEKPFTPIMWIATFCINLYNGFVVWFIERKNNQDFRSNNRLGTTIWLAFTTLFTSLQGDKLHTTLGKMVMVVWLFVAMITTQTFTASLTSFLTIQNLNSNIVDVETLIRTNAKVGCDGNSFVPKYMENVLHFDPDNIVPYYSGDDYIDALNTKKIEAAILEIPYIKVLRAKYCNISNGESFKVGGFGFVFERNANYLPNISEAILNMSESGKLLDFEKTMLSKYKCASSDYVHNSVGLDSFSVLFIITALASTLALVVTKIGEKQKELQLQASSGQLKINTDGGSDTWHKGSFGGLVRYENGKWVEGFCGNIGAATALRAEFWAIRHALQLCKEKNWVGTRIETDCEIAVKMIGDIDESENYPNERIMAEDCRKLIEELKTVVIHIPREANKCANTLAKIGSNQGERLVRILVPPQEIMDDLIYDATRRGVRRGD